MIPPELGNLTNLTLFKLDYNQIQGSIPQSLCKLTKLTYLILGYNQMVGAIPECIGELTEMYDLELHNNYLTGRVNLFRDLMQRCAGALHALPTAVACSHCMRNNATMCNMQKTPNMPLFRTHNDAQHAKETSVRGRNVYQFPIRFR
jgi:hypothetical protein